jgi:hypothetical protein
VSAILLVLDDSVLFRRKLTAESLSLIAQS